MMRLFIMSAAVLLALATGCGADAELPAQSEVDSTQQAIQCGYAYCEVDAAKKETGKCILLDPGMGCSYLRGPDRWSANCQVGYQQFSAIQVTAWDTFDGCSNQVTTYRGPRPCVMDSFCN